jgi:catechol-2,3-dioxygenase
VPDAPCEFRSQHDCDLHIALAVDAPVLATMLARGREAGIPTRGISDHGIIRSVYFEDPNGYVIELAATTAGHDAGGDPSRNEARALRDRWQKTKQQRR